MIEIGRFRQGGNRSVAYIAREGNKKDNFPTLEDLGDYMKRTRQTIFRDLDMPNVYPPVEPLSDQEKMTLRRFYRPDEPTGKTKR